MSRIFLTANTLVFGALAAATLLSFELGGATAHAPDLAWRNIAAITAIAFAKIALILFYFMELRHAALLPKILAALWLVATCGAILAIYPLGLGS